MGTIVLLPGMDGSGILFKEFVAALPASASPIIVVYPPDQPLGYDQLEEFVSQKLPSHEFILLGESFSGPIALTLAAAAPPGLRGVVLVGSFARMPIPLPSPVKALLTRFPVWRLPPRLLATVLLGRGASSAQRKKLSTAIAQVFPATWRVRFRAVFSVDVVARLCAIRVPVLYIRGTRDWVVPKSAWRLIQAAMPGARLAEIDGPHFLLQAKPVDSAAAVSAFAKEVGFAL